MKPFNDSCTSENQLPRQCTVQRSCSSSYIHLYLMPPCSHTYLLLFSKVKLIPIPTTIPIGSWYCTPYSSQPPAFSIFISVIPLQAHAQLGLPTQDMTRQNIYVFTTAVQLSITRIQYLRYINVWKQLNLSCIPRRSKYLKRGCTLSMHPQSKEYLITPHLHSRLDCSITYKHRLPSYCINNLSTYLPYKESQQSSKEAEPASRADHPHP